MKQIKDMTTAEWRNRWLEASLAYETLPSQRNEVQYSLARAGLCWSFWQGRPDGSVFIYDYLGLFRKHWPDNGTGDAPYAHDLIRSTYAAMFAAMTPREFLAICEAPRD